MELKKKKNNYTEIEKLMGYRESQNLPFSKFKIDKSFKKFTEDDLIQSIRNCFIAGHKLLKKQLVLIYNQRHINLKKISEWINTEIDDYNNRHKKIPNKRCVNNEIRYALDNGLLFYYEELVKYKNDWEYDFLELYNFGKLINNFRKSYIKRVGSGLIFYSSKNINNTVKPEIFEYLSDTDNLKGGLSLSDVLTKFRLSDIILKYVIKEFKLRNISKFINNILIKENRTIIKEFYKNNDCFDYNFLFNIGNTDEQDAIIFDILGDEMDIYFYWLYENDQLEHSKKIFELYFNNQPINNNTIFEVSSHKNLKDHLQFFIPSKASCKNRVFCMLCEMGDLENAKMIYQLGADYNCHGSYPIIKSLEHGHIEVAEWLLTLQKYDLTFGNYMLFENVAFYGMYHSLIWLMGKYKLDSLHIKKILKRCREGKDKGSGCYQISQFYCNDRYELFGSNTKRHDDIIRKLLAVPNTSNKFNWISGCIAFYIVVILIITILRYYMIALGII